MPENIQSIIDIVKSCDIVYLATMGQNEYPDGRIIMNKMNLDINDLNLHFLTSNQSPKYQQIKNNPHCCFYYFNPKTRMSVRIYGIVTMYQDEKSRKQFWRDEWMEYGYTGWDDPNFTVLSLDAKHYKFYRQNQEISGEIK